MSPSDGYKYWAFISYSHADEKWATWLHRALETYRIPKQLVGKDSSLGESIPAKLFPVFRDRDELAGASELGGQLTEALRASRTLLVICSPRSAKSHWVNEEVKYFKSLGRQDRVYCVIVDGEPGASEQGAAELECFPKYVRCRVDEDGRVGEKKCEPLAADARPNKDGKSNTLLKSIAGILGVSYDSLHRRAHRRAVRRLQAVALGMFVLVGVLMALTVWAMKERDIAIIERERAELESLVNHLNVAKASVRESPPNTRLARSLLLQTPDLKELHEDWRWAAWTYFFQTGELRQFHVPARFENPAALGHTPFDASWNEQREMLSLSPTESYLNMDPVDGTIVVRNDKLGSPHQVEFAPGSRAHALQPDEFERCLSRLETQPEEHQGDGPVIDYVTDNGMLKFRLLSSPGNGRVLDTHHAKGSVKNTIRHHASSTYAFGCADGSILGLAHDGRSLQLRFDYRSGPGEIAIMRFSPDGRTLHAIGRDWIYRSWHTRQPADIEAIHAHEETCRRLDFNQAGDKLVSGSYDGFIKVWSLPDRRLIREIRINHDSKPMFRDVYFRPGHDQVVTSGNRDDLRVWDIATGRSLMRIDGVRRFAVSPDGRFALTSNSIDLKLKQWDLETGQRVAEFGIDIDKNSETNPVYYKSLLWHADADVLFGALSPIFPVGNSDFHRWDAWDLTAHTVQKFEISKESGNYRIALNQDGNLLAIASTDGTASVWDWREGKRIHHLQVGSAVSGIDCHPSLPICATGSIDGRIGIWSLDTGRHLADFAVDRTGTMEFGSWGRVKEVRFSPNGKHLAIAAGKDIWLVDLTFFDGEIDQLNELRLAELDQKN